MITTEVMHLILAMIAIVGFSVLAYWRPFAPLFIIMAAISMVTGLAWYDIYTNGMGLGISIALIVYSFLCFVFAFRVMLGTNGEEE